MKKHWYIVLLLVLLASAAFRVAVVVTAPCSATFAEPERAVLTTDGDEELSSSDELPLFALTGYSPVLYNSAFSRRTESQVRLGESQPNEHLSRTTLIAIEEACVENRMSNDISYGEALVVGLPAWDIPFPFHSFW